MADCFDGLIEVSESFVATGETTPAVSASGLYMDRLEGLNMDLMDSAASNQMDADSVLSIKKQIKEAVLHLKRDIFAGISMRYRQRNQPYRGLIGSYKFTKDYQQTSSLVEWKLKTRSLEPTSIRIKRLGLLLNQAGTITLTIEKTGYIRGIQESLPEVVGTYDIPAIANPTQSQVTYFVIPADSPLFLPADGNEYKFSYTLPEGSLPKENKISCSCSIADRVLSNYIENPLGETAKGIIIDAEVTCDATSIICLNMEDDNDLLMAAAFALRYKTGELMLAMKKVNPDVNKFILLNDGEMNEFMSLYLARYEANKNYLAQSLQMTKNACYVCDNAGSMQKIGILI